jgi:NAD(P)-dependent dehydrogenase (short-subunit alcohol dehydrogenase family)
MMTGISFAGRVAIITGAGGGIGRTYALDIARRGGSVLVNDLGGDISGYPPLSPMADDVVAEIQAAGGKAIASGESVATVDGATRIVEAALSAFGRVDALINNAGIMRNAPIEEVTEEDIDATLGVHLRGTLNLSRAVWPHMKAAGYGRIVFTSSATGMYGNILQSAYGAAKAGVAGLMNVLSIEGAPHGILCNGIMPHAVGRMGVQMVKDYETFGVGGPKGAAMDIGNAMEPEFNAGLGVFLASETCTSTHALYSSCVGRYARVFVGATPGWQAPRDTPPTADQIAGHFDEICDTSRGFIMPASPRNEIETVLAASVRTPA